MASTLSPPPPNPTQTAPASTTVPVAAGVPAAAGAATAGAIAAATTGAMTVLAAGLGTTAAAAALAAVLTPLGVTAVAAAAAWQYASHAKPATHIDLPVGDAVQQVLADAPYYQAAYIVHAALRIQRSLARGMTLAGAVRAERRWWLAHRAAQRGRLRAAQTVDRLAAQGHPWLTWRLGDAAHHTPACRAANGHPFPAARKPAIGWPGSTHPGCTCYPTPGRPPRRGQLTVDQATGAMAALGVD